MKKIESNNIIADYMLNESVKLKKEEVKLKDYEEDVYEVEKIIKKQRFGSEWKYKIKWVGYPDNQCTWEPKDNLSKEMLKDFEIELGLKEKNKAVQSIDSSVEKSSKKKKKKIRNESRRKEYKFDEKDFLNNKSENSESNIREKENDDKEFNSFKSLTKDISDKINFNEDLPLKIISVLPGEAVNEIKCLIEWKTRENGQKPPNSLLSNKLLRKNYPDLLFDFYEARINFRDKK